MTKQELVRMIARSLFYFLLISLIMLLWEGGGLFIYENF